jgi:hypothetical protein
MMFRQLLAQAQVQTNADLLNLWNRALGPLIIFGAVFGVVIILKGISMDRSSGEWKSEILKGISIFFAVPVVNVIFNLVYNQSFHVQW